MAGLAMFLPGLISAGGSLLGGLFGKSAAERAAEAQKAAQADVIRNTSEGVLGAQAGVSAATGEANDILSRSAATQLGMYAPYVSAGQEGLQSLKDLALSSTGPLTDKFAFAPTDLASDPGYQFTLQQGQQAIQRAAAAKGGLFSSGTLKSLAGYTTGTANQYFNDAFNRALETYSTNRQTALNRIGTLQGLAQLGYGATGAGAGAVGNTSAQQAQNQFGQGEFNANLGLMGTQWTNQALSGQGNVQAAEIVGGTNALTTGISGALNSFGKTLSGYLSTRPGANTGGVPLNTLTGLPAQAPYSMIPPGTTGVTYGLPGDQY